jgi:hypothetical protein
MIKALLVDGDGIVLKSRDKYFSQRLVDDGYKVNEEKVKELHYYLECTIWLKNIYLFPNRCIS